MNKDIFGIGAAVKGAAEIYFRSARRTGRTTNLVSQLKSGDTVYCINEQQARDIKRHCHDRNVAALTAVIDPKKPQEVFDRPTAMKRAVFDHVWVEQYYLEAIEKAAKEIEHFQNESSKNHEDFPVVDNFTREKWRI